MTNEFSWSYSRHRTFSTCKREYYYRYYGSWGGWEYYADELTQRLYRLKNMITLPMLVGDVVHRMISVALESLKEGHEIPSERVEADVIDEFKKAWRQSKKREWKTAPKRKVNLFEHYYGGNPTEQELLELRDTMIDSIHGFYLSDSYRFIKTLSPREWLTKEELDSYIFQGTKIWVKLDFAARHGERIYLYDWKTGKGVTEDETQLAVYALYAQDKWGIDLKDLRLFDIYLKKQLPVKMKLSKGTVETAKDVILQSINGMVDLLDDQTKNTAKIDSFPMVEDMAVCRRCSFKEVCYPDSWEEL